MQFVAIVLQLNALIFHVLGSPVKGIFKAPYNVTKEGRCPMPGTVDWVLLADAAGCDNGEEYHCAKNRTKHFVQACDKPIYCLRGKEPVISEIQNYKVSCEYCQEKGRYNPEDSKKSSTFSQCPETQNFCIAVGTLQCQTLYGVEVYYTKIQCRCDARNGYKPRMKDWQDGDICTDSMLRCEREKCPSLQERMLNYSCAPVCEAGYHRTAESDDCVRSDIEPATASIEQSTAVPSSPTTTTTKRPVTSTPLPSVTPNGDSSHHYKTIIIVLVPVFFVILCCIIVCLIVWFRYRHKLPERCQKKKPKSTITDNVAVRAPMLDRDTKVTLTRNTGPTIQRPAVETETLVGGASGGPGGDGGGRADQTDRGNGVHIAAPSDDKRPIVQNFYFGDKTKGVHIGDHIGDVHKSTKAQSSDRNMASRNVSNNTSTNNTDDEDIDEGSRMLNPNERGGACGGTGGDGGGRANQTDRGVAPPVDPSPQEPYQEILNKKFNDLVRCMDPSTLLDKLTTKLVIDTIVIRDIRNQTTVSEKNRMIIQAIQDQGSEGFGAFKECLRETGQYILEDRPEGNGNGMGDNSDEEQVFQDYTEEPFKKILSKKYDDLVKDMDPDKLLDKFTLKYILEDSTIRDIRNQTTVSDKNRMILDIIRGRGPEDFEAFKECLRETGQQNVLEDGPEGNENEMGDNGPDIHSDGEQGSQDDHEGSRMLNPAEQEPYQVILSKKNVDLLRCMDPDRLLNKLTTKLVLDDSIITNIKNQTAVLDKNRMILDTIRGRGPEDFETFKECLRETGQYILEDGPEGNGNGMPENDIQYMDDKDDGEQGSQDGGERGRMLNQAEAGSQDGGERGRMLNQAEAGSQNDGEHSRMLNHGEQDTAQLY